MAGVFISYRRGPVASIAAGRLYDRLADELGDASVFMDVDTIEPGEDFIVAIDRAVSSCDALLAVIQPGWADVADSEGNTRLDDPSDYVRLEIATALRRNIRVIPVLLEGASLPRPDQLPTELDALARRQAVTLTNERWATDIVPLLSAVRDEVAASLGEVSPRPEAGREDADLRPAASGVTVQDRRGRQTGSPTAEDRRSSSQRRARSSRSLAIGGVIVGVVVIVAVVANWNSLFDSGGSGDGSQQSANTSVPPVDETAPPDTNPASGSPTSGCVIEVAHIGAAINAEPSHLARQLSSVPDGSYPVLDWEEVDWAGLAELWFLIEVDGRQGWIFDNTILIASKSSDCP